MVLRSRRSFAVRRRARARQPAVLPRLRAGARARAAALPDALRGHLAPGARRRGARRSRCSRSSCVAAQPPRADAAVPRPPCATSSARRTPTAASGPAPGAGSTQMHTGWAALGLAAAGRNPRDVERGGNSVIDYMRANAGDAARRPRRALAHDPRPARRRRCPPARLGGRDLVGELAREQEGDGSFAGLVNTTAFAVLALRAAGRGDGRPRGARAARRSSPARPTRDGGFNFAGKGGPSGADDTGAALQALAAAGPRAARGSRGARRAGSSRHQNADGGFSLQGGAEQRAVDRVGGPGADRRRARPGARAARRLALADRLPALARRPGRRDPLLAHEHADAGLGHRAGADGARGQGAPARAGAARAPRGGSARAGARRPRRRRTAARRAAEPRAAADAGRRARAPAAATARRDAPRLDARWRSPSRVALPAADAGAARGLAGVLGARSLAREPGCPERGSRRTPAARSDRLPPS